MAEIQDIGTIMHDILAELRLLNQYTQKMTEQSKIKDTTDPLLSVNEAADYCKVSRQTISTWIRNGRLTKVARGCRVGLLQSTLDTLSR